MHCRLFFRGRGDSLLNIYPAGCANTRNIHIPIPATTRRTHRVQPGSLCPPACPLPPALPLGYPSNHPFASFLAIASPRCRVSLPVFLFLASEILPFPIGSSLHTCVIYAHLSSTCVYAEPYVDHSHSHFPLMVVRNSAIQEERKERRKEGRKRE